VRADQVRPLTAQQIEGLRHAARYSHDPLRAFELCAITIGELDTGSHRCTILGKGNKYRVVYFGRATKSHHLALPVTTRCLGLYIPILFVGTFILIIE
jgi:integrase